MWRYMKRSSSVILRAFAMNKPLRIFGIIGGVFFGLGVLLGILPGWWLTGVVFRSCETDTMVFASTVSAASVLLACAATFLFSCLITALLTRKVRTIDMVEALKSVE